MPQSMLRSVRPTPENARSSVPARIRGADESLLNPVLLPLCQANGSASAGFREDHPGVSSQVFQTSSFTYLVMLGVGPLVLAPVSGASHAGLLSVTLMDADALLLPCRSCRPCRDVRPPAYAGHPHLPVRHDRRFRALNCLR